jgi:putative hydrolase of the HAD superfamily
VTRAVFFDVDFTLIYPGTAFQGEGYQRFCARHGITVDPALFAEAVNSASAVLDEAGWDVYDPRIFTDYTARIIDRMGGRGPAVQACAAEIYDEWAVCRHFMLYEEVPAALQSLSGRGLRIGLISNSHRCLESFQSHFELEGLIDVAVSSSKHGYMKPHPSIFRAALELAQVRAAEAVMVGDSLKQDVDGARGVGMRGVLVRRSEPSHEAVLPLDGVPVIRNLLELAPLL